MEFTELVVSVHSALRKSKLRHAFGGALALGYIATPRGTVDIDVNVFAPVGEMGRVTAALRPLGFEPEPVPDIGIGGIRFHNTDPFPVDVFPSLDERYEEIATRIVHHAFGTTRLPFLSPEDLSLFKLSFGRPQDWVDLAAIAQARPKLDVDYIERQLVGLRGPTMYPRLARLRALLRSESV